MTLLGRLLPARRRARRAYLVEQAELNRVLHDLHRTVDPSTRADLFLRLSTVLPALAALEVPAFGRRAQPLALHALDDAAFARIFADTERARATSTPRQYRDRPDLEARAGGLLDMLADPATSEMVRCQIYTMLQVIAHHFRSGPGPIMLLEQLKAWHAQRANAGL